MKTKKDTCQTPPQRIQRTRVILLIPHGVLSQTLLGRLRRTRRFEVLTVERDPAKALQRTMELRPELLAADLLTSTFTPYQLISGVPKRSPQTRVVAFNAPIDQGNLRAALRAGAAGYLGWDASLAELIHGLELVAAGGIYIGASMMRLVPECILAQGDGNAAARPQPLTKREQEIADRVAQGQLSKEIADSLSLSVRTVEQHRQSIGRKRRLNSL